MASPLVQFRVPEDDLAVIEAARKRAGAERADWLRSVVMAAARAETGHAPAKEGHGGADPFTALVRR